MNESQFAYLAEGKLHLRGTEGDTAVVESAFASTLRDRAAQIHQRHAWKTQGRGARFMPGMLWPTPAGDPGEFPAAITSVCRGHIPGELLYSLETDDVAGIFAIEAGGLERRLFHTSDFRFRDLALSPDGTTVAASVLHGNCTSHIALLQVEGTDFFEATEGDSVDLAPDWVPGCGRKLVFQSAGVGRNRGGQLSGLGPFTIQELELDSGRMDCLAEEPGYDLLAPRKAADGSLYYIRRPYESGKAKLHPLSALKDALLFPFRMAYAMFQYFNFFSLRYTGKPLATSGGAARRQLDWRQMLVMGNLINAAQEAGADGGDSDARPLVPASWQLVHRSAGGRTEVLATRVLSFDLTRGGSVVYTSGGAVYRLRAEGRPERIFGGRMIEQVVALPV
jgi:hypothetical protein